jgi:hypothetical protein
MNDYRATLRKIGFVLLLVGIIDIGLMIYVVAKGQSYSSSLNILAVIAGVFLVSGNLSAARVVTWFAAFFLTAACGVLLFIVPFFAPLDLWLTEWRLGRREAFASMALALLATVVLIWVYRMLRSPEVLDARAGGGQSITAPRSAFVFGALAAIAGALLFHSLLHGNDAAMALEMAKAKIGPGYKFVITGMRQSNGMVRANVTAYNEGEVKAVELEWTH